MAPLKEFLDRLSKTTVPGVQYAVFGGDQTLFEYAGGWADVRHQKPMGPATTLMAFSMTKTFTAAAVLQLVERGDLGLDDKLRSHLPDIPYDDLITIRHVLCHTSGIPNPIPLRWVHLAEDHVTFDEGAALARVLHDHPRLSSQPGRKYAYSNIGYWLLAKVIERVTERAYASYVRENVIRRLGIEPAEMDYVVVEWPNHAIGYLAKYSVMNLLKGLLTDRAVWGEYAGKWLSLRSSYVNGPGFGGLVGSSRAFGRFLQDQLGEESRLFGADTRRLFFARQKTDRGEPIPMSLGWHVGALGTELYYFKEGGGAGFHSEMRIYPTRKLASVIMVNATDFRSNALLSDLDQRFEDEGRRPT
jgi:CubicO group peptidase (beta-lactamase class C family)